MTQQSIHPKLNPVRLPGDFHIHCLIQYQVHIFRNNWRINKSSPHKALGRWAAVELVFAEGDA